MFGWKVHLESVLSGTSVSMSKECAAAASVKAQCHWPISSAGLFGRLLMNVSNASFMALTNFSFFMKQTSMMWSTLSLKSSSSCTIVLSFSGLMTIVLPNACRWVFKTMRNATRRRFTYGLRWYFQVPPYLDVFYPVLQKDLDAAPHSIEELVEKRQILNSVLIQQMSQPWRMTMAEGRLEQSVTFIHHPNLNTDTKENTSCCHVVTSNVRAVYLFAGWLWDVRPEAVSPQ